MLQYSEVDGHPEDNCVSYQGVWKLLWGTCNQEICVSPVVPVCMQQLISSFGRVGSNPITGRWAHSSAFCPKFASSWETLHVLSHGTYISHGFQVMVPPQGDCCSEVLWQEQHCCWAISCYWGRWNVCGRKEEMTLLCGWGTGLQHYADLPHSWHEGGSKVVNGVQDVCVLAQPFSLKNNCLCSFQLLLLLLCCKIRSYSTLAFLDILAFWK